LCLLFSVMCNRSNLEPQASISSCLCSQCNRGFMRICDCGCLVAQCLHCNMMFDVSNLNPSPSAYCIQVTPNFAFGTSSSQAPRDHNGIGWTTYGTSSSRLPRDHSVYTKKNQHIGPIVGWAFRTPGIDAISNVQILPTLIQHLPRVCTYASRSRQRANRRRPNASGFWVAG
jgi:hypothetical protein